MASEKKKFLVKELIKLIQTYPVVALVNMENLPAQQLQKMRAMLLKKGIIISMTRKRLLKLALDGSGKKNIGRLVEKLSGMPALLFSKENSFVLYSILQKNKSSAPARANQTAPRDIIVPAGMTGFAPGPIISELASVGIKTKVEGGKLAIVQDTVLVREGEAILPKVAETLKRLDIQPMEIGLNLVATLEEDILFEAKQLHIDEEEYNRKIMAAYQDAFNLAIEAAYPAAESIELLLQISFREAKALALGQEILTDLTTADILAKAERQAFSLKEEAGIEVSERKREEEPEEKIEKEEELPSSEKEEIPTAEEMIKATKERFVQGPAKKEETKITAEELIGGIKTREKERKKKQEVKETEQLYDKLKKEGTLR